MNFVSNDCNILRQIISEQEITNRELLLESRNLGELLDNHRKENDKLHKQISQQKRTIKELETRTEQLKTDLFKTQHGKVSFQTFFCPEWFVLISVLGHNERSINVFSSRC